MKVFGVLVNRERQNPQKLFRFSKCCSVLSVIWQIAGSLEISLIWWHGWLICICFWWSQASLFRAWLAGWLASLYLVQVGFGYFIFIIRWPGIGQFLAAVYFYQLLTFLRLHRHARSALISLLLITCPILIWPDLFRSDDISLLRSDLVFYVIFCWKVFWWTLWSDDLMYVMFYCYDLWICAHSEANFVMTTY